MAETALAGNGTDALTNYLSQTILGMLILNVLLGDVAATRVEILIFCLGVWGLQLWWSPGEKPGSAAIATARGMAVVRVGRTYRKGQPLRR